MEGLDVSIGNDVTMAGGGNDVALARIDQYEIYRKLGGGGFGSVYFAKDTVAGIDVAVKGLPPVVRNNNEELERIRENFALVSRLHHPNIAAALHLQRVRDVVYNDVSVRSGLNVSVGDTLMVMEYAPGVTLSQWTKQFRGKTVPLGKAVAIVGQIADGLDFAHSKHILHRDIKPSNVMIETSAEGEVTARLLDFGLAAEMRSSMGRVSREIHDTSGTRPYMAPEQWAGKKQGPATDQYALAVVFCELVTGEVPFASSFECGDPVVMKLTVCNDEPELPDGCPFKGALLKALAKQPENRFGSCADFVAHLTQTSTRTDAVPGTVALDAKQAREMRQELERKRQLEEVECRQHEQQQREQAAAERARAEQAEIESLKEKIEGVRREISEAFGQVEVFSTAHPEYGTCLATARKIKGIIYEDVPKDLPSVRELYRVTESSFEKIRRLINDHDVVVCATLDGVEVNGVKMLYGARALDLPVRIKGRQILSEDEGYRLRYVHRNREYVGWFSPSRVASADGNCAMVPLHKIPSTAGLAKSLWKRNVWGCARIMLVALATALIMSAIVCMVVNACMGEIAWPHCRYESRPIPVTVEIVFAIWTFLFACRGLVRREMWNILYGKDAYRMCAHPTYRESELALDRSGKSNTVVSGRRVNILWALCEATPMTLAVTFAVGVYVVCAANGWWGNRPVSGACCVLSVVLALIVLCRRWRKKRMLNDLLNRDRYRTGSMKSKPGEAKSLTANLQAKNLNNGRKWPRYVMGAALIGAAIGGLSCLVVVLGGKTDGSSDVGEGTISKVPPHRTLIAESETVRQRTDEKASKQADLEASRKQAALEAQLAAASAEREKAEQSRQAEEHKRQELERQREESERQRKQAELVARQEKEALEAKLAAERAERERIEQERQRIERKRQEAERKHAQAEKERLALERAEAERVARESAQLSQLKADVSTLRNISKNMRAEPENRSVVQQPVARTVSLEGRSSVRFTAEDAQTLSLLKFSSANARNYYQRACDQARRGAHNKAKVRSEYNLGRACGGPEWPELEAWLDWWK